MTERCEPRATGANRHERLRGPRCRIGAGVPVEPLETIASCVSPRGSPAGTTDEILP